MPPWPGPERRLGVGVRARRPLHRRGLGPCGQGRQPLCRPPARLRRRHRPLRGSGPDVARGIKLRHDWGSQYRAHHFQGSLNWLGIEDDAAFVGEPQGNGVAERFIRTLKEQCLWARLFEDVDKLRQFATRSSRPTTPSGSSSAWATERLVRRLTKRQRRLRRDPARTRQNRPAQLRSQPRKSKRWNHGAGISTLEQRPDRHSICPTNRGCNRGSARCWRTAPPPCRRSTTLIRHDANTTALFGEKPHDGLRCDVAGHVARVQPAPGSPWPQAPASSLPRMRLCPHPSGPA